MADSAANSAFNFFQHWYPLSPIADLDPNRPTPVMLLNRRLVVWKPRFAEHYRVFLDQCPHRLAPLSEGRVDEKTGNLMCSYHGWQFDQNGTCTHLPQAENPDLIDKNRPLYCASALPVQEVNGLLWVWPDQESAAIAASRPLPLSSLVDESKGFVHTSMVRDLEYDWQTLIENVADPSHVQVAHHGIQGDRDHAKPIPIEVVQSSQECIEVKIDRIPKTRITFIPPCHLEYEISFGPDKQLGLVAYCLPVTPGKSRLIGQFSRTFAKRLHYWTPRWVNHLQVRNPVLDGDMILLHYQERYLQERMQTQSWKTAYKLPTQADRMVVEFRRWIDQYCQGQMPWGSIDTPLELPLRDRSQLLDRYHQHTVICSSCRNALKTIRRIQFGLLIYFAVALAIVAVMPDSLRLWIGLPLAMTALLGLGGYGWLKYWLEPKFYFVDYVHAERK